MMPATLAFIHIQTYSCNPLVDLIDPWIILDHIGSIFGLLKLELKMLKAAFKQHALRCLRLLRMATSTRERISDMLPSPQHEGHLPVQLLRTTIRNTPEQWEQLRGRNVPEHSSVCESFSIEVRLYHLHPFTSDPAGIRFEL